ncbi:hypothetical protein [Blautia obeum]|uniref:Uncharacterized protein n=1 Tax=Blautia obeum A2-162 TaxID=657314 RepID=D4LUN0_9FIRM|nr:hypothetical protein [Blautia obeum]CBL24488.1 hypothetical protein CK5_32850 [Blautia obeum A2-162]
MIFNEINPDFRLGCMILRMPVYPLTADPSDVKEDKTIENHRWSYLLLFFITLV